MGDLTSDYWFAGFVDGEGCFALSRQRDRRLNRDRYLPQMSIALRLDDLPILEAIRSSFGGRISITGNRGGAPGTQPSARWYIAAKAELAGLVAYFDRFPPRAKKHRDWVLWRQAVEVYCERGGYAPELPVLCEALRAGRQFDAPDADVIAFPSAQLSLVEEGP